MAIGGAQTGIYPIDSPGGWYVVGKMPIPIFGNGKLNLPFNPGDKIQFEAISSKEFTDIQGSTNYHWKKPYIMGKIVFIKAGLFTTIQDQGRFGFVDKGIPTSGPMDESSFHLANLLVRKNQVQHVWRYIWAMFRFILLKIAKLFVQEPMLKSKWILSYMAPMKLSIFLPIQR